MYFKDYRVTDYRGENYLDKSVHIDKLLAMLTTAPRKDPSRNGRAPCFGGRSWPLWPETFPPELTISAIWCRLAMRAWLKTRKIFTCLESIEQGDFARLLKPKTLSLFQDVNLHIHCTRPIADADTINSGLQQMFRTCSNIRNVNFDGNDELLLHCGYWWYFPDEDGETLADEDEIFPTPEEMFGGIPWVKTLLGHKKLQQATFPPGHWCDLAYNKYRDDSGWPNFPSAEMTAALESLQMYVREKIEERDTIEDLAGLDVTQG